MNERYVQNVRVIDTSSSTDNRIEMGMSDDSRRSSSARYKKKEDSSKKDDSKDEDSNENDSNTISDDSGTELESDSKMITDGSNDDIASSNVATSYSTANLESDSNTAISDTMSDSMTASMTSPPLNGTNHVDAFSSMSISVHSDGTANASASVDDSLRRRVIKLQPFPRSSRTMMYLCKRDMRIQNNAALFYAQKMADHTIFAVIPEHLMFNDRQRTFIAQNMHTLIGECADYGITFMLIDDLATALSKHSVDGVIVDYSPLREAKAANAAISAVCAKQKVGCVLVDAHNIVPYTVFETYYKSSVAVKKVLLDHFGQYMNDVYEIKKKRGRSSDRNGRRKKQGIDKDKRTIDCLVDELVGRIRSSNTNTYNNPANTQTVSTVVSVHDTQKHLYTPHLRGGYANALQTLNKFIKERLSMYKEHRNNVDRDVLSHMSAYINMGQISAAEVVQRVMKTGDDENVMSYLNEVFVWRETAEYFCEWNENYDNFNGASNWAKETLVKHMPDKYKHADDHKASNDSRIIGIDTKVPCKYLIDIADIVLARTSDETWNAVQKQLIYTGKIHGYARMYWAKQLHHWCTSPYECVLMGCVLNDMLSLDGNDASGYLGIMWSAVGAMDRGFGEKDVLGKVRSMRGVGGKTYVKEWNERGK